MSDEWVSVFFLAVMFVGVCLYVLWHKQRDAKLLTETTATWTPFARKHGLNFHKAKSNPNWEKAYKPKSMKSFSLSTESIDAFSQIIVEQNFNFEKHTQAFFEGKAMGNTNLAKLPYLSGHFGKNPLTMGSFKINDVRREKGSLEARTECYLLLKNSPQNYEVKATHFDWNKGKGDGSLFYASRSFDSSGPVLAVEKHFDRAFRVYCDEPEKLEYLLAKPVQDYLLKLQSHLQKLNGGVAIRNQQLFFFFDQFLNQQELEEVFTLLKASNDVLSKC